MKTVSAMGMRRRFGGWLDKVRATAEPVLIERDGKPMAVLAPLPAAQSETDGRDRRRAALDRLCRLSRPTSRGRHPERWVERERDAWTKRP